MKKLYCPKCDKEVEFHIKNNYITEYKGIELNVLENIAICNECEEELFEKNIEEENLKRLYKEYKIKAGLVTSEDIVKMREKYNLSQRELTAILGWGKMTLNRYERGAIQSKAHNDTLKLIIEDKAYLSKLAEVAYDKGEIEERTYSKVRTNYLSIENQIKEIIVKELKSSPNINNGFRIFDIDRLENLISYIASIVGNLTKTSVNKYLYYIDVLNYFKNQRSITGLSYIKNAYGPTIIGKKYELIISLDEKYYTIEEERDEYTKVTILSKNNFDMSSFDSEEIEVIDAIIDKFKKMSVGQISELSHEENGWKHTDANKIISYEYAESLKLIC